MRLSDLDQLARKQHGVVARRQTDLTRSAWRRAVVAGSLVSMHPGVARLVGTADTVEQRIAAAVLACGPRAMASHRSAAHLHGIPSMTTPPIDLIVRPRHGSGSEVVRHARALDGATIHRPRDGRRLRPHRIDNIACTNILRTLLDLGAVAEPDVHGAVGHALTNDLASLDAIETALGEHATHGRHGVRALRAAIDDWAIDAKPADSVLEPAMARLAARYGLPPMEFHARVGGREVDFRLIGLPIVIECDGWRYHGRDRRQFERDRAADAEFAANGWIVLRFTYRKITTRPSEVADQINRSIERWASHPVPA